MRFKRRRSRFDADSPKLGQLPFGRQAVSDASAEKSLFFGTDQGNTADFVQVQPNRVLAAVVTPTA